MKNLTNLNKVIKDLNSPKESDGEMIESQFDFTYKIDGEMIYIYDRNECYNINYEEDMNCMLEDAAYEFGFKFQRYTDDIMPRLEQALKDDANVDVLEWETTVRMVARIGD